MSSGETGEPPSVAEGLRSATFLGRVSRKQSRCQLSNDPKGSAKECRPRLEALGRHRSLPSEDNVTIFGLSEDLRPWAASQSRTEGRRRQNLRPSWFPLGGSHQRPIGQKAKRGSERRKQKRKVEAVCGPRFGLRS